MAYSLPTFLTTFSQTGTGVNVTSSSVDTSPYDIIIIATPSYFALGTLSDNKNSSALWKHSTSYNDGGAGDTIQLHWLPRDVGVSFGSGHTFTISSSNYPTGYVLGATGALTSSDPKDLETGNNNTGSDTIKPGSLTPTINGALMVTAFGTFSSVNDAAIDLGSYTIIASSVYGSLGASGAVACSVQTTATARDPQWTNTGSIVGKAAVHLSLKPNTLSLRRNANLTGIGAAGPFFQDPLGAKSFVRNKNHIYVPKYIDSNASLSL